MPPRPRIALEAQTWRVYVITHVASGIEYFGQTCESLNARWRAHVAGARRDAKTRFLRAIRDFGHKAFEGRTLIEGLSQEEASDFESMLIRSKPPERVFNEYESGGALVRQPDSLARGARISQSPAWLAHRERLKAQWADPEQRAVWMASRKPRGFNQASSDWWANMSAEERSAQALKRWETRRRKASGDSKP